MSEMSPSDIPMFSHIDRASELNQLIGIRAEMVDDESRTQANEIGVALEAATLHLMLNVRPDNREVVGKYLRALVDQLEKTANNTRSRLNEKSEVVLLDSANTGKLLNGISNAVFAIRDFDKPKQ